MLPILLASVVVCCGTRSSPTRACCVRVRACVRVRVCVRVARVRAAGCVSTVSAAPSQVRQVRPLLRRMERRWGVAPDGSTLEYAISLLCQGQRQAQARPLLARLETGGILDGDAVSSVSRQAEAVSARQSPAVNWAGSRALHANANGGGAEFLRGGQLLSLGSRRAVRM
eukprot:SAG25_NODE_798_length_5273_cov_3.375145_2_plen_170_part_00